MTLVGQARAVIHEQLHTHPLLVGIRMEAKVNSGRGECVVTRLRKNHDLGSGKKKKTRPDLHLGPRFVARVISSARCQGITSFSVHISVILTYLNLKYEVWWN